MFALENSIVRRRYNSYRFGNCLTSDYFIHMKSNLLSHKGYHGSIEPCLHDAMLNGHVLFVETPIQYSGLTIPDLRHAFEKAVDQYLEHCARTGQMPVRPFKGQFNVRITPRLHQSAALCAQSEGTSLNNVVVKALQSYLEEQPSMANLLAA